MSCAHHALRIERRALIAAALTIALATGLGCTDGALNESTPVARVALEVGPTGGTVLFDGASADGAASAGTTPTAAGSVVLEIPAGALTEEVLITVEPAADVPSYDGLVAGTARTFGPDGLRFAHPATLTLTYDPAQVPATVDPHTLRLHKAVDQSWQEISGSTVDLEHRAVQGRIVGFSSYAIRGTPGSAPSGADAGAGTVDGSSASQDATLADSETLADAGANASDGSFDPADATLADSEILADGAGDVGIETVPKRCNFPQDASLIAPGIIDMKVSPPCSDAGTCDGVPGGPFCDPIKQVCVLCLQDADCDGNRDGNACIDSSDPHCGCRDDSDCIAGPGNTGKCNTSDGSCERCDNDDQCRDAGLGQACDVDRNLCVDCMRDEDCNVGPPFWGTGKCRLPAAIPKQDPFRNDAYFCDACDTDQDCIDAGLRPHCHPIYRVCLSCLTHADCATSTDWWMGPWNTGLCHPDGTCLGCESPSQCLDIGLPEGIICS